MSEQAQQLTPEQAQLVLLQDVAMPAFVEKCAALGLNFESTEQAVMGYETVRMINASAAAGSTDLIKAAHSDLCSAMGVPTEEEQQATEQAQQQAGQQAQSGRIQSALTALAAGNK